MSQPIEGELISQIFPPEREREIVGKERVYPVIARLLPFQARFDNRRDSKGRVDSQFYRDEFLRMYTGTLGYRLFSESQFKPMRSARKGAKYAYWGQLYSPGIQPRPTLQEELERMNEVLRISISLNRQLAEGAQQLVTGEGLVASNLTKYFLPEMNGDENAAYRAAIAAVQEPYNVRHGVIKQWQAVGMYSTDEHRITYIPELGQYAIGLLFRPIIEMSGRPSEVAHGNFGLWLAREEDVALLQSGQH